MRDRKMLGMGLIIGSAVTSGVVCSKAVTSLLGATAVSGTMGALGSVLWPLMLVIAGALLGFGLYKLGCFLQDKISKKDHDDDDKILKAEADLNRSCIVPSQQNFISQWLAVEDRNASTSNLFRPKSLSSRSLDSAEYGSCHSGSEETTNTADHIRAELESAP